MALKIPKLFDQAFDKFPDLFSPDDRAWVFGVLSNENRVYHGVGHHGFMISEILRRNLPREFLLATFFHDLIYDPLSKTNEQDSADMLAQFIAARPATLFGEVVPKAIEMVLASKDHTPKNEWSRIFCEIDCLILASRPPAYCWYAEGIRQEYAVVNNETYRIGRPAVLDRLATTMPLFFDAAQCERADRNFRWEKAMLRHGGFDLTDGKLT